MVRKPSHMGKQPATGEVVIGFSKDFADEILSISQQWMYPCGGMPMSTNRSLWPVSGGALALQPGWFSGTKDDHVQCQARS